jgi:Flp pilus assembly protein TadB
MLNGALAVFSVWMLALGYAVFKKPSRPAVRIIRSLTGEREGTAYERIVEPILKVFRLKDGKHKDYLSYLIDRAGVGTKPEEVVLGQIVLGIVGFALGSMIAFSAKNSMFLIFAGFAGVVLCRQPVANLKEKARVRKQQARLELPDFIDMIILLLSAGYTVYQAVKKAVEKSKLPALEKDLRLLSSEIEVMGEKEAFERFADRTEVQEARSFASALEQASKAGAKDARAIFEQQTKTMRDLRIATIRKLIKERPAKMKPYNYLMMGLVIGVPMLPIIMTFLSMGW